MLTGQMVIEEFGWDWAEAELPLRNVQTGEPTGETVKRKVLRIQTIDSQHVGSVLIEIRMAEEHFELFKASMNEAALARVEVAQPGALKALPDIEHMFNGKR